MTRRSGRGALIVVSLTVLATAWLGRTTFTQATRAVAVDNDDLGGVVTSPRGPEAGGWGIAETKDLPTPYRTIVVTEDAGRYLVPDLPQGNYSVWVRGYGLVDSPRVEARPGKVVN